ncbi:MAG TPA: NAD-dependent deacylase [Nitrospira sp.]|nr:NAD-dependent deacylase [Nitrospira sp.]
MSPEELSEARSRVATAQAITVLTGAGISADSGVPTFRGANGLWRNYRAEDLATPEAFQRDPRLVWEWYNWRRELIATKRPNPAHHAVAALEARLPAFWLITQNVDGLHRVAGSHKLSEIHGNIWMVRCTSCGTVAENHQIPLPLLPSCDRCRGLLRPHIVWFGESLDQEDLARCAKALQDCDVLIVIGTSGVVYPAAGFASVAKEAGAFVIEVNPDPTPQSDFVDIALRGHAKDLVPDLLANH